MDGIALDKANPSLQRRAPSPSAMTGTRKKHHMAPRTLFFVANLDPLDGSAHALYCARNAISLANNCPPGCSVVFLHASGASKESILSLHNAPETPSLRTVGLPHVRRKKWFPINLNTVFHKAAARFIQGCAQPGDTVSTASFPEMLRFLGQKLSGSGIRMVYEVHQLEIQSRHESHEKCTSEFGALAFADVFITTCEPLAEILSRNFPEKRRHNLGLAASYGPVEAVAPTAGPFRIGYFGSVSTEQGIPWLASQWPGISQRCGRTVELHIHGRNRRNEDSIPGDPPSGLHSHGPIPSSSVPAACAGFHALVIPALDQAHRASIAFTKAYDYAGLALPILAADLPTVREVLAEGTHALFFRPGCADSLAACIKKISADPGLAASMSANLRLRAAELSWNSRARRWWEAASQ
jgi:glycosyltransferase involved in cell wall biosynthesis